MNAILIVAGDPSGDQHGASLARALKVKHPNLMIHALGGVHLKQAADHFVFPLVGVGGFGFWEPLLKFPQLWKAWRQVRALIRGRSLRAVIPIDYYGFNIHVARLAKQQGIPAVYYISPQVWASRPQRINALKKVLTKMLVIFPFEERLYQEAGIPVRFVGHPLLDRVPLPTLPMDSVTVGLMPGSRWDVVERHLPILMDTARYLRGAFPQAQFLLFRPAELAESRYAPLINGSPWLKLTHDPDYAERRRLSLAIGVSGTAALENTLLGIPMIIMYKLSSLTYTLARHLIKVPYIAIPNILAQKRIVPEFLQEEADPEKLAAAARRLLQNPSVSQAMRQDLLVLRSRLGHPGAARLAADEIGVYLNA
jgi:lipid-A-disaccharide synthase